MDIEQRISDAIRNFYASPDYSVYSMQPTDRHKQVHVEVGHRRADVDEQIAPLIAELWKRALETGGSCQARPEGSKHAGKAYVGFWRITQGEQFKSILDAAGMQCELEPKKPRLHRRRSDGTTSDELAFDGANVLFKSTDIAKATEALRQIPLEDQIG